MLCVHFDLEILKKVKVLSFKIQKYLQFPNSWEDGLYVRMRKPSSFSGKPVSKKCANGLRSTVGKFSLNITAPSQ
jgi:hypothetical protein